MKAEQDVREILDAQLKRWTLPADFLSVNVVVDYQYWSSLNGRIAEKYAVAAQHGALPERNTFASLSHVTMAEIVQLQLALVDDPRIVGMFALLKSGYIEHSFARYIEGRSIDRAPLDPLRAASFGLLSFVSLFGDYVAAAGAYSAGYLGEIYRDLVQTLCGRDVSINYLSAAARSRTLYFRFMSDVANATASFQSPSEGGAFVTRMTGWAESIARLAAP